MNIEGLRNWINNIPEKFNNNKIMFRTVEELDDDDILGAFDVPIISCGIDEENDEMYLCNAKSMDIINKG